MCKKKKVIAQVLYNLNIGGVTNVVERLLRDLRQEYELVLIILADPKAQDLPGLPVKTYRLSASIPDVHSLLDFSLIWLRPGKYFSPLVKDLVDIVEKEKINVFHFHGLPKDLLIGKLVQDQCPELKLVYTDHLMRIAGNEYRWGTRKLLSLLYKRFYHSYHVLFVSKAIADRAQKLGFINKTNQSQVVENTVDADRILRKSEYNFKDLVSIVYVSRISKVKGHFLLPLVAEILIRKFQITNFCFHLIGPGELTDDLQNEISSRGLDQYFSLEGPRSNVHELLCDFDLAVFPSEKEGLPVALLEKMAAGLPVVASDIPEITNVIQYPNEALLFPVNNPDACASQINRLINDQGLREKIGTAARQAVAMRYAEPLGYKYAVFYQKLF